MLNCCSGQQLDLLMLRVACHFRRELHVTFKYVLNNLVNCSPQPPLDVKASEQIIYVSGFGFLTWNIPMSLGTGREYKLPLLWGPQLTQEEKS